MSDYEPKKATFAQNARLTVAIIVVLGGILILLWWIGARG